MATGTIIINDDLRTMQIPDSITLLGVESDDDVNKIAFQMPKEYSGFDLSEFQARINYMNANGVGDLYVVDDLAVDGDNMTFSWLVGRNACAYKGDVQFIVCLKKFKDDGLGDVVQEFNTTVYKLPVLQGLETTEAVVQQNPDIIEKILQMIEAADIPDLSDYYTKAQVDQRIPTKLPNPEALTINGTEYDGSEAVNITVDASSEVQATASGQIIHVVDAIPKAVKSLTIYDSNDEVLPSATVCVANKNLFRIDLLPAAITSKGVSFTKDDDGGIIVNGTATGDNAAASCVLDPHMFAVGRTYTLSSGKSAGVAAAVLDLTYTDNTTEQIAARNSSRTFTISKAVSSVTGSVQVLESGAAASNEVVFSQLEIGDIASAFAMNVYSSMLYDGTVMPVLPDYVSNVWSSDSSVSSLTMEYDADSIMLTVDEYVKSNLIQHASKGADSIPEAPVTDGTYVLQVTVSDGQPVYTWVTMPAVTSADAGKVLKVGSDGKWIAAGVVS